MFVYVTLHHCPYSNVRHRPLEIPFFSYTTIISYLRSNPPLPMHSNYVQGVPIYLQIINFKKISC